MMSSQVVPQGYKQTKVGVIPEEWDLFRIDTILQRIRKKVNVEKDINYQQIGIRSHAKGIFHKKLMTGEELGNKSVFWIEEDCFIVNIVFAWEQAVAKTTKNERGMIASHRFPMYQPKNNKVNIDYLLYFFKSKRGKHLLGLASPGGAGRNKTLGQGEFSELKIPLPPLKEQQKIANILTTWDDTISKQDELIKAKEELKKGLMQLLLSGEIRFSGFSGEWEEIRLGDIGKFKTSSVDKKIYDGESLIKLLNYMDVYKNKKIDNNYHNFTTVSASDTQIKTNNLQKGDIVFTPSSETPEDIGHSAVILEDLTNVLHSYHVVRFRLDTDMDFDFRGYVFNNKKTLKEFSKRATGSTRFTLSIKDFNDAVATIPTEIQEQQKIAKVLSNADKEIDLLKNELEVLKEQKKGLMQKLLTGEVRVRV